MLTGNSTSTDSVEASVGIIAQEVAGDVMKIATKRVKRNLNKTKMVKRKHGDPKSAFENMMKINTHHD